MFISSKTEFTSVRMKLKVKKLYGHGVTIHGKIFDQDEYFLTFFKSKNFHWYEPSEK